MKTKIILLLLILFFPISVFANQSKYEIIEEVHDSYLAMSFMDSLSQEDFNFNEYKGWNRQFFTSCEKLSNQYTQRPEINSCLLNMYYQYGYSLKVSLSFSK